jgi:DNA polymerase III subunit delta'
MNSSLFATTHMNKPLGYEDLYDHYNSLIGQKRLPQSLIIYGKKGSAKEIFAKYLAHSILNIENIDKLDPHPDYLAIQAKDITKKREITIDQTRQIHNFMSLTPAMSNGQIILIDRVEDLNIKACNNILKILEEPPKNRFFLLLCENIDSILDTIKSRCQIIKMPILAKDKFHQYLAEHEIENSDLEKLYKIFPNQPLLALEFLNNQGLEMELDLKSLNSNNLLKIKEFVKKYDLKDMRILNNFSLIINYLSYEKMKEPAIMEDLNKFISNFNLQFQQMLNLNLDKNNFISAKLEEYYQI